MMQAGGRNPGIDALRGVSIVMVVAYHKINQYGEDVASLGRLDPILAFWVPFVLFAGLIIWMYYRVAYVPGGQAIGWLEKFASGVGKRLRSLMRRQRVLPTFEPDPVPAE